MANVNGKIPPSSGNWVTVSRGHFSRLYFEGQEDRREPPMEGENLNKTDYEGKRYTVPQEAIADKIEFSPIDKKLKDAWRKQKELGLDEKEDIRLLREIQWKKERSDYEYRYWLQCEVEKTSTGQRSLKILMSLNEELESAQKTWDSFANDFSIELTHLIEHVNSVKTKKIGGRQLNKELAIHTLHPDNKNFKIVSSNQNNIEITDGIFKDKNARLIEENPSKREVKVELTESSILVKLPENSCRIMVTDEAKAIRMVENISKATIKVLFQTFNQTQNTLNDTCASLNKAQLVDFLLKIDKNYNPEDKKERELQDELVNQLEEDKNREIRKDIHKNQTSFSQTPSAFLLKLYPQILDIVNPPNDYFVKRSKEISTTEYKESLDVDRNRWAIKISRYIHFLLCRMDWIRISIASPTESGYYLDEDVDEKQISLPHVHRLSPKILDRIKNGNDAMVRRFQLDPKRTMYCLPKPHTKGSGGGFHTSPNTRAGDSRFRKFKNAGVIQHEKFEPSESTLQALNHLQGTQWSVNLDLLECIAEFTDAGKAVTPPLTDIRHAAWVKNQEMKFQDWIVEGMGLSFDETPRIQNWGRILNLARKNMLNGCNVFWHAWWCDWRGRFYTRTPNLGPQGDDLSKALLLFTEWKPLGVKGRYWFFVKMYDLFKHIGENEPQKVDKTDKKTFDERFEWTRKNSTKLLKMGVNPRCLSEESRKLIGFDVKPTQKSETFQRFAALLEFCRIHEEHDKLQDWDKVTSGFPIHLDASCNGFQHMAALLRDEKLAKKVNVLKGDKIGDLYQEVADKAKETLVGDPNSELAKFLIKELNVGPVEFHLWAGIFSRNLCKKPVMIAAYGAQDLMKPLVNRSGSGTYINVRKVKIIKPDKLKKYIEKVKNRSFFEPSEIKTILRLLEKYEAEGPFKEELSENEKEIWEKLEQKLADTTNDLYIQAKRTLHPESPLYSEMKKINDGETLPPGWKTLFFEWKGGKPDEIQNALRCWEFARQVSRHIMNAILEVTGNSHKYIQDGLKLIYACIEEEGFFSWSAEDEHSSKIRSIKLQTKENRAAGLRTVTNYNERSSKDLFLKCIELLKNNSTHLNLEQKTFQEMKEYIDSWENKDNTPVTQSKACRDLRSTLLLNLIELSNFKSPNILNKPNKSQVQVIGDGFHEIQDLIVGLYSILSIDVPIELDDKWKSQKKAKIKTGLTPNFIHSFDAKHMENVINSLASAGIKDFWSVHDSFGVHACNVDILRESVRKEFVNLHKNDFTEQISRLININEIPSLKSFAARITTLKKQMVELAGIKESNRKEYDVKMEEAKSSLKVANSQLKAREKLVKLLDGKDSMKFDLKRIDKSEFLIS